MTLRTTSIRHQYQAWAFLALLGVVAYFVLVLAFKLGNPFRFFGPHQMRVLLPIVIFLRILAREFRWDGIVREEEKKVEVEKVEVEGREGAEEENLPCHASIPEFKASPVICQPPPSPQPQSPPQPQLQPEPSILTLASSENPAELWSQALEMVPALDPEMPIEECESYMTLVHGAAEGGCVAALARLGELAFARGAFVEAYFWTKLARRRLELEDSSATQGLSEIDGMLRNIRRGWSMAGQPPEYENVYDSFPEERGELGRAFLRLDSGLEVRQTKEYLQLLAEKGNPDAALFC